VYVTKNAKGQDGHPPLADILFAGRAPAKPQEFRPLDIRRDHVQLRPINMLLIPICRFQELKLLDNFDDRIQSADSVDMN